MNSIHGLGYLILAASAQLVASAQLISLCEPSPANGSTLLHQPLISSAALVLSNAPPRMPGSKRAPLRPSSNASGPEALAPGIYETHPYTCIVVVPGEHPDDKCIIGGRETRSGPAPRMPMRSPDLQFVPRRQGSSFSFTNAPPP